MVNASIHIVLIDLNSFALLMNDEKAVEKEAYNDKSS